MRIQYEINERENKQIEDLMKVCGIKTKRGFLSEACTLFAWVVEEKQKGRKIFSDDGFGEKIKEFEMPALMNALKK